MRLPDRILEPVERLSEILFGLIMALTITGAVSVATADHFAIRTMLLAALGCNVAWGIIDAGMYLMARLGERGRNAVAARAVRETVNRDDAHRMIADELPPLLAPAFQPAQLELIRERIRKIFSVRPRPRIDGARLARCIGCLYSRYPVHVSGRHSIYCHCRCQYGRCALQMRWPSYCYFCVASFSGVTWDSGPGQQVWLWWRSALAW